MNDVGASKPSRLPISSVCLEMSIRMIEEMDNFKNFVILKFANKNPHSSILLEEHMKMWTWNNEWILYPFTNQRFLVQIKQISKLNCLVADVVVDSVYGRILIK